MQIIYFSNLGDKYLFFCFFQRKNNINLRYKKIVCMYEIIIVQCISPPHHDDLGRNHALPRPTHPPPQQRQQTKNGNHDENGGEFEGRRSD